MSIQQAYDQIASDYALKRSKPGLKMTMMQDYLRPGMRILDLGCGHGRFFQLMPKGCDYVGLDFSKELLKIARRDYPLAKFVLSDMTDEKVWHKLGRFDAIFSFASFHHLMTKQLQIKTLKLCHDYLVKNGWLVIVVWNLLKEKKKKVIKTWKLSDGRKAIKTVYRPYYAFTPEELKNLVQKAGFKVEKTFFIDGGKEFGLISTPGVAS